MQHGNKIYIAEFNDSQNIIKVKEGCAAISAEKTLVSEGFFSCSAVIIINQKINDIILLHLINITMEVKNDRDHELLEKYNDFISEKGRKIALPLENEMSNNRDSIYRKMESDGIEFLDKIDVGSPGKNWNVACPPKTRGVIVWDQEGRMQKYQPFPPVKKYNDAKSQIQLDKCIRLESVCNNHLQSNR